MNKYNLFLHEILLDFCFESELDLLQYDHYIGCFEWDVAVVFEYIWMIMLDPQYYTHIREGAETGINMAYANSGSKERESISWGPTGELVFI